MGMNGITSRYQEALNNVANFKSNDYLKEMLLWENMQSINGNHNEIELLQELIDNYSTMEEQVKNCEHSADKKIEQLEKALDKAVDVISSIKRMTIKGLGDSNYSWNESVRVALFSEEATFEINNEESEKQ